MKTLFRALIALILLTGTVQADETTVTDVHMHAIGDIVTLPDGSMLRYYWIDDVFVDGSIIDNLHKVVSVHCNDDGCAILEPNSDRIEINKERVVALVAFLVIRVAKPHWLPNWLTGRSSGGGSSGSAAAVGGGPPGVPGGPI
ncbi:hypothetical protein ACFL6I_16075 [candidate division KSB1 bacterium]